MPAEFGNGWDLMSHISPPERGVPSGVLQLSGTIIGNSTYMFEVNSLTDHSDVDFGESPTSIEIQSLTFKERCEQWLMRSHDVTNPIALELTNVPLWMREQNDNARAQALNEGRPFEPVTLGSFSTEQLEVQFHNDDAVYLINLYQEDPQALEVAQRYSHEWSGLVSDFNRDVDVRASGFAIMAYEPNSKIAKDWEEVEAFIERMHELGKKVIVDFVPNHVGLSHPWAKTHPDFFIEASAEESLRLEALRGKSDEEKDKDEKYLELSYHRVETDDEDQAAVHYYAHGKDPYFIPWIDTLQLNYTNPDLQRAMRDQLLELVTHGVDGVRCDMAHLPTHTRMRQTWGYRLTDAQLDFLYLNAFWPPTIIETKDQARQIAYEKALAEGKSEEEAGQIRDNKNFLFIAEAYEDRDKDELGVISQITSQWASKRVRGQESQGAQGGEGGFDLIYAKDLLDHLHKLYEQRDPYVSYETVRKHLKYIIRSTDYNHILFLENHDEDRAVAKFGSASKAFATLLACVREVSPPENGQQGTVFMVNQGQDEGRAVRPRMQMARLPSENPSQSYVEFYKEDHPESLIKGLLPLKGSKLFQQGTCTLLDLDSSNSNPAIFAFRYEAEDEKLGKIGAVVTVNLGNHIAAGRIAGIEKSMDLSVVSMTMRREIERPDNERTGGLYIELSPYEVQVAYYNPESSEIEPLAV